MTREETLRNLANQVNDFVCGHSMQETFHAMALELCHLSPHHRFEETEEVENSAEYELYWSTRSQLNQHVLLEAIKGQHNLFGALSHEERKELFGR